MSEQKIEVKQEDKIPPAVEEERIEIEENANQGVTSDLSDTKTEVNHIVDETVEQKCGMTCFLNHGVRLSGMIKQRHTDFIVRECDPEEKIVQLTDLNHIDDAYEKSDLPLECPVNNETVEKIKEFVESGDKTK